ncbi:MAG: alpha/beta hydrolase [Oscillospiraceae bacterium]|nr:alpha/beta hydrolase [Oscillospiraceae bacterium]
MNKSTKRKIIIGASIVTACALTAASAYVMLQMVADAALKREKPKLHKITKRQKDETLEQSVFDKFEEDKKLAAEKLNEKSLEEVSITSRDDLKLVGHWWLCENAKRTVICFHGWHVTWDYDFGLSADFLHDNDCNILFVEQRAHGNSEGEYTAFGLLERYDCLDWISWVNERCGSELPVYLYGLSMGAATVLMTTGLSLPENVKGVIADSGYSSAREEWKHVFENNSKIPYNRLENIFNSTADHKLHTDSSFTVTDALRSCNVPVLFIHGTEDDIVPIEMAYENYNSCPAPKRLYAVDDAGHCMNYFMDKTGYEVEIKSFWERCE